MGFWELTLYHRLAFDLQDSGYTGSSLKIHHHVRHRQTDAGPIFFSLEYLTICIYFFYFQKLLWLKLQFLLYIFFKMLNREDVIFLFFKILVQS